MRPLAADGSPEGLGAGAEGCSLAQMAVRAAEAETGRPLAVLADMAHFSPYHFHRTYVAVMGESVSDTRQRLRLQTRWPPLILPPSRHRPLMASVKLPARSTKACSGSIC